MNTRIQELAEQAGWLDDKQFASWNKLHQWQNFDKEKFAELIVRECANEIIKQNEDEIIDDWDSGYVAGLRSAVAVILEHFGVEE